jgi:hypothetical protein
LPPEINADAILEIAWSRDIPELARVTQASLALQQSGA